MKGSSSSTLLFTTTSSVELPVSHQRGGVSVGQAFPGVYSCTIQDYGGRYSDNDDDYEDDGGYCVDPQRVADGRDVDVPVHDNLEFMNLQFYLSSKNKRDTPSNSNTAPSEENNDDSNNDDGNNYLYGATMYEHPDIVEFSWEILRANPKVPTDESPRSNDDLLFHTYFRTIRAFDWNNCEFDCCPFNDDVDSNGVQAHRDRHDSAYLHSYIRTVPRAFAVDKNTGDIFIAWEGFYKNCNPADIFSSTKMLEWTIGVSRLKTHAEDPTCVSVRKENGNPLAFEDMSNNFSRCTEPVSIAFMGTHGREVLLPYGGFSVIPAAAESPSPGVKPRRSFLLSVFQKGKGDSSNHPKEATSTVWAIPEGADVTRNLYKRQELTSTLVRGLHMEQGVWNGGNIRMHYNRQTGRPDHLCRSVFNKGIVCMPIEVTEDGDSVYVTVTGDQETFLTEDQVSSFCVPGDEVEPKTLQEPNFRFKSTVATGLEVLWNEEDGTPQRIFFGCYGMKSNGKLGSVDKDGANLNQMLPGAYSGDVVLLPRELDSASMLGGGVSRTAVTSSKHDSIIASPQSYAIAIMGVLLVVGIALYGFYKKRFSSPSSSRSFYSTTANNNNYLESRPGGHRNATYMELPVISSNSSSTSSF
jgi:hypothetical protein